MAIKWTSPGTLTSIHATELNSLADGSESSAMTFDNSTSRELYSLIRISLGSITPVSNGSISVKLYGPNADISTTPIIQRSSVLTNTTGAKEVDMIIQLPPFSCKLTLLNNSGVSLAASGNNIRYQSYSEADV